MPYLSASEVVFHEEVLYQVYIPLPLYLYLYFYICYVVANDCSNDDDDIRLTAILHDNS